MIRASSATPDPSVGGAVLGRSFCAARPDGAPIYVSLDNLSVHKGADIRRWAKKHKIEPCFTPSYASRANPIEAHF